MCVESLKTASVLTPLLHCSGKELRGRGCDWRTSPTSTLYYQRGLAESGWGCRLAFLEKVAHVRGEWGAVDSNVPEAELTIGAL